MLRKPAFPSQESVSRLCAIYNLVPSSPSIQVVLAIKDKASSISIAYQQASNIRSVFVGGTRQQSIVVILPSRGNVTFTALYW